MFSFSIKYDVIDKKNINSDVKFFGRPNMWEIKCRAYDANQITIIIDLSLEMRKSIIHYEFLDCSVVHYARLHKY